MKKGINKKTNQIKRKILPTLRKHDVVRAGIFGSFVRGEDISQSDLDILVEFSKSISLFDLIGLQMELEKKIHKKVDVVPYNSIDPYLKDRILKEEVNIL